MDAGCRIELLGWLRVRLPNRLILRFRTRQTGVLLAYLALHRQRAQPRDQLATLCWPDGRGDLRHQLRNALSSLRRQLEPPGTPSGSVICADRVSVQLNPQRVTTDVAAFEAALQAAQSARGAARRQQLTAAVTLYGGELLPGYLEDWIVPERQRLANAYLDALAQLAADHEQQGELSRALEYARRVVAADPLREEGQHELIRLLIAGGRPEAARQHYAELERLLAEETGAEPAAETRALLADLPPRRDRPPAGTAVPAPAPRQDWPQTDPESAAARRLERPPSGSAGSDTQLWPTAAPRPPLGTVTFLLAGLPAANAQSPPAEPRSDGRTDGLQQARSAVRRHGGILLREESDSLLAAFERASDAAAAAAEGMQPCSAAPEAEPNDSEAAPSLPTPTGGARPRMILHTGEIGPEAEGYDGPALARAATLLLAAHPGQILCSEATATLLRGEEEPGKPGYPVVSLGAHRLRDPLADIPIPVPLFHLRYPGMPQQEFPGPHGALPLTGALPPSFTRFFGREAEIEHLCALLSPRNLVPHSSPLVTLTGPGGSGKTRLALEVARRLVPPFNGAIWFVPLAGLKEAALIPEAIRAAMQLPPPAGRPPLDTVMEALARQPSLLLLDNCEHLIEAAAAVSRTLLERVPALTLLVTSRQPLALEGEQLFAVAPLPIPGVQVFGRSGVQASGPARKEHEHEHNLNARTPEHLETLLECASIRLFADRAQAVRPDFQLTESNAAAISAVCARLDGLPLALELAAARAGALSLGQILTQLEHRFQFLVSKRRDAIDRHRSLRAALDWSYELLPPGLQRFFARLALFRGGWTLEAAAAVALEPTTSGGASDRRILALAHLDQLRQCSLLVAEEIAGGAPAGVEPGTRSQTDRSAQPTAEMRYRMLETVREYGAERLAELGEVEAAGQQHMQFFSEFLDEVLRDQSGRDQISKFAQVERENDNLRAALAWALEHNPAAGPWLAARLCRFWAAWGYWTEARGWLEHALSQNAPASTLDRANALVDAGVLAYRQGEFDLARAQLEHGLRLARGTAEVGVAANALVSLGAVAAARGDYRQAQVLYEEAAALQRQTANKGGLAAVLASMGLPALQQGDYALARRLYQESLELRQAVGQREVIAASLVQLGAVAQAEGNYDEATRFYEQGLAMAREFNARLLIASAIHGLGRVALARGESAPARALHAESLAIRREMDDRRGVVHVLETFGEVELADGQLSRARDCYQESLTLCRELGLKPLVAPCLEGMARVAAAERQARRAAQLFGAATALREALGTPVPPSRRLDYERHLATLRDQLGEAAFASAWSEGRALTAEQAAVEALRG